ncbi:MAG: hypothetical protein GF309_02660 [Candidatus Lokiarchaeota archaeon]|nr:hypothetical protein [Candidatus Lokiarchaeota archaeon]
MGIRLPSENQLWRVLPNSGRNSWNLHEQLGGAEDSVSDIRYAIEPEASGENLYWSNRGGTGDFSYTHSLADIDEDFDGLSDSQEDTLGTNSTARDSDGDSIPDTWEYCHGFDPLDSSVSLCEFVIFNNQQIAIAILGAVVVSVVLVILKKKERLKQSITTDEKNES